MNQEDLSVLRQLMQHKEFDQAGMEGARKKPIHSYFEEQVRQSPERIALVDQDKQWTYAELDQRASRVAGYLMDHGVAENELIGIFVERSAEMIVSILAILKAGAAYMPIDADFPPDRITYMLEESGTRILLTQQHLMEKVCFTGAVIDVQTAEARGDERAADRVNVSEQALCYVIYTSGSTGKPKGVMISHKAVVNLLEGICERIDFSPGKSIIVLTTISFDIFVLETLIPLARGMTVVIANMAAYINPRVLNATLLKHHVDMLQGTPTRILQILQAGEHLEGFRRLSEIIIGGEHLAYSLVQRVREVTSAKIYNAYGPTEATVWATIKEMTTAEEVTIGTSLANTSVYIVDEQLKPLSAGDIGELCISGDSLAVGYLNNPELTDRKFVNGPFGEGKRLYLTGDIAKTLPNGEIVVLGRKDEQVKIRGHRVELKEVEHVMMQHPQLQEAAVIAVETPYGYKNLYAFFVAASSIEAGNVKEFLSRLLPAYMIPSYYHQVNGMPLTPNGKLDRLTLRKWAVNMEKPL